MVFFSKGLGSADKSFLLCVLFLMGLGLVQVYSSSFIFATEVFNDGFYFFRKQLIFSFLGLFIILCLCFSPPQWLRFGGWIWVFSIVGVLLTLFDLGIKAGGATRWLRLPFEQRIEPSEFLKIGVPFLMGLLLTREIHFLDLKKHGYKVAWVVFFLSFLLLLKQPDFGSFLICVALSFAILFVYGIKWRYVFLCFLSFAAGFYLLVINVPYRYSRVLSFLDPWADPSKKGFQAIQSMLTFQSGGVFGVGLGEGQGKLFFLPEAHTDFTLAILAEEVGFLGFSLVLFIYGYLIYKSFRISLQSRQPFFQYVSFGLSFLFTLSVFLNIGVVLGLVPTKGLTLPFLSYGGSSLVATCFLMGALLNIDRLNKERMRARHSGFGGL